MHGRPAGPIWPLYRDPGQHPCRGWDGNIVPIDRRLLGFGLFFLLLGGIPLGVRAGALSPDLVSRWTALWPLLLIGWGLAIVLDRAGTGWLGRTIVVVSLGTMGGGLIATGFSGAGICGGGTGQAFGPATGTFGDGAGVEVDLPCGSLSMNTADGRDWRVGGTDAAVGGPVISADPTNLRVDPRTHSGPLFGSLGAESNWTVTLPRSPALDLAITVSAGSATVDLTGATIHSLSSTLNAGSLRVDASSAATLANLDWTINAGSAVAVLPATRMSGSVTLNAGSLRLCVPADAALAIQSSESLGSDNFGAAGLSRTGDTWVTTGATGPTISLSTTANAGSITLERGGACHG